MKKLATLLVLLALLFPTRAMAASSCTQTIQNNSWLPGIYTLDYNWIAHTDGTFTSVLSDWSFAGWIIVVETNPGAVAPTTLYDVTLSTSEGTDILGGAAANRSATDNEVVFPYISSTYQPVPVLGRLTLAISGNSVNSATGLIRVYFIGTFKRQ